MNRIFQIFTVLLLIIGSSMAFLSCGDTKSDSNVQEEEYIIFGSYFGQCVGNCVQVYKIDNSSLWIDEDANYSGNPPYNFKKLPDSLFQKALPLISNIPSKLHDFPEKIYGCPDCADQGGMLFGIYSDSTLKIWRFDNDISQNPQELQPFIKIIQSTLISLKN